MSLQILSGQLLVGLINGSFYALLSLGFAVIFGLLGIINVAQGTFYMLGAFGSWMLLNYAGIGYWPALILSPVIAGAVGMALEKTLIARVYKLDHIYGLLLTYGVMMFIQGMFVYWFATAAIRVFLARLASALAHPSGATPQSLARHSRPAWDSLP